MRNGDPMALSFKGLICENETSSLLLLSMSFPWLCTSKNTLDLVNLHNIKVETEYEFSFSSGIIISRKFHPERTRNVL